MNDNQNTNLNFLSAGTYEDLCHFSYSAGTPVQNSDQLSLWFSAEVLYDNAIIFCKTDYLKYLFPWLKKSMKKYILITHHSDFSITFPIFSEKPYNVKKWFAINVAYKHPDLIPIPIGLPTYKGEWYKEGDDPIWIFNNSERLSKKEKNIDEVYCNWNLTHENRKNIIPKLQKNALKYKLESGLTLYDYYESMSNYKFVIAPPGNGNADTYRVWEALYMGCFPIVKKLGYYDTFKELPIIQVKDYSEVTYELLNSYLNREYNYEKLYLTYWKNKIYEEFKKL